MRSTTGVVTRKRIVGVFVIVGFMICVLLGRLSYVQIFRNELYRERALDQRMRPVPVDAKRGTIYDRKGRELAVSVSADSVYAIPAEMTKPGAKQTPRQIARKLGLILGADPGEIYKKLVMPASTVWVQRKISPEAATRIRAAKLAGIGIAERSQRFYPKGNLACHILGLAGIDNQGLEGVEVRYDRYLKGTPGRIVAERDGKGRQIPQGLSRFIPPQDGDSVYLTIDEVVQYIAERELDKAMEATGATKGVVCIMDPMTGEILALANRPDYNPNSFTEYPTSSRRNTAIADAYEPGSTFKAVTAAAALEEGIVRESDTFDDPGYIVVGDRRLKCWKAGGHGHQTFIQAVENSCNPVFVRLATGLGKERFYQYIKAFGFGKKTGVDFPGESSGLVAPIESVGPVELATIGFGQGVSVTPLQMVNALATIVNGGSQMEPHILKSVRDADGKLVKDVSGEHIRQVISEATSKEVREILASVVANGSGKNAGVPGYRVGGKTGTAQIPDKGRYGNKVVASFMGFAPVDNPRVVGLVALYEPTTPVTFGSVLAAPVFGAIVKDTLRYLEVRPTEDLKAKTDADASSEDTQPRRVSVPDMRNLPVVDAMDGLLEAGLKGRYTGDGTIVNDQVPKPGAMIDRGSTVILNLRASKLSGKGLSVVTVPDLSGYSIKQVGGILARIGLRLSIKGSGLAASQRPEVGAKAKLGTRVQVVFEDVSPEDLTPSSQIGQPIATPESVFPEGGAPPAPGAPYGLHP